MGSGLDLQSSGRVVRTLTAKHCSYLFLRQGFTICSLGLSWALLTDTCHPALHLSLFETENFEKPDLVADGVLRPCCSGTPSCGG